MTEAHSRKHLMGFKHLSNWRRIGHIPVLIALQIIFIILFGKFVIYHPGSAQHGPLSNEKGIEILAGYPMFQDVHVMIFIGFGFLMTFLKKYGLSAVSLNMLCAVICLQWATLVFGFFHLHEEYEHDFGNGTVIHEHFEWPGKIFLNIQESMLFSDFAAAAVLISFGAVIGKTSPLQLIVMTLSEVVFYVVNEVVGRKLLGAIDAGDTFFVHVFGAYFGLAVSRALYNKDFLEHENEGSDYTHDLFSMIGTIFLWMFWPSFNAATAIPGDAQQRALLNTYFSLCGCVMCAFAMSALMNEHKKFVMEHIQNATLAGGVAIGACADLMIQPWAALLVGGMAGIISVLGFEFSSPFLRSKLKIHDTCGVNNLHGMPGIFGALISCILAALATTEMYGESLTEIYPALKDSYDHHNVFSAAITPSRQAVNQLIALIVTLAISIVGGTATGLVMRLISKYQRLDEIYRPGTTVVKLALAVGNVSGGGVGMKHMMPKEAFFDDNLFFEVHEELKQKAIIVTDAAGRTVKYEQQRKQSMAMEFE